MAANPITGNSTRDVVNGQGSTLGYTKNGLFKCL